MTDGELIGNLLHSRPYKALQRVSGQEQAFSLFGELEEIFRENCSSRFLCFLMTSDKPHGMRVSALRAVAATRKILLPQDLKEAIKQVQAATAMFNWRTPDSKRYLDVLVIGRRRIRPTCVLGIENKFDAPESPQQIGDYQRALDKEFGDLPKALLFLSRTGEPPTTADESAKCRAIPVSHRHLCDTFRQLSPVAAVKPLLNGYLDHLTKEAQMAEQVEELILKLLKNPKHRGAMALIRTHNPSFSRRVLAGLVSRIEQSVSYGAKLEWTHPGGENPHEVNIAIGDLNEKLRGVGAIGKEHGEGIHYMLKCGDQYHGAVTIGDRFDLLIMLQTKRHKTLDRMKTLILPSDKRERRRWGPWHCLWAGNTYTLADLGKRDKTGLAELVADAVKTTYKKIRSHALQAP